MMAATAFLPPSPLIYRAGNTPTSKRLTLSHRTLPLASASAPITPPPTPTPSLSSSDRSDTPAWTGDGPASRFANFLIHFPPLKILLRYGARNVLISTAEQNGVDWRGEAATLNDAFPPRSSEREQALAAVVNPQLEYPSYYTQPFHAYQEGNLGWLPAFEARSATICMSQRTFPDVSPQEAFHRMRAPFFQSILNNAPDGWLSKPQFDIIDAGCGVGLSTRDIAARIIAARSDSLPPPTVKGIDTSPYFLVVANKFQAEEDRDKAVSSRASVEFVHALAENTGYDDDSFDLWSMQFVTHELPNVATKAILDEAFRVLRSGGVFALLDQDPHSEVVRSLPPVLGTLMKFTEPYTDQYYFFDIAQAIENAGFDLVKSELTTPRHRCFIAVKP